VNIVVRHEAEAEAEDHRGRHETFLEDSFFFGGASSVTQGCISGTTVLNNLLRIDRALWATSTSPYDQFSALQMALSFCRAGSETDSSRHELVLAVKLAG